MIFFIKKTEAIKACYQIDGGNIEDIPQNGIEKGGKNLNLWKRKEEKNCGEYSSLNISLNKNGESPLNFELNIKIGGDNKWNLGVIKEFNTIQSGGTGPTTTVTIGEPL